MSAKPWWEQRWEVGAPGPCGGRVVRVEANGDRNIIADECDDDAEKAFAAAPDMARALLAMLRHGTRPGSNADEMHTLACWDGIHAYLKKDGHGHADCERLHAALTKAGVTIQ